MFHIASGNLGFQVEHHLFPDMPSTRYAEIAPQVKGICEKYELPYNTGPFLKQLGMVQRTILRLALPGGKVRPKPGPYKGGDGIYPAAVNGNGSKPSGENGSGPEQKSDGVRVEVPSRAGGKPSDESENEDENGGQREAAPPRTRCRSRASSPAARRRLPRSPCPRRPCACGRSSPACAVLRDPLAGEVARLDVGEDLLHRCA